VADGGEQRFLEMIQPDVPTQSDLEGMNDAQLCELLSRAGGS
jgi:hypothetical protein